MTIAHMTETLIYHKMKYYKLFHVLNYLTLLNNTFETWIEQMQTIVFWVILFLGSCLSGQSSCGQLSSDQLSYRQLSLSNHLGAIVAESSSYLYTSLVLVLHRSVFHLGEVKRHRPVVKPGELALVLKVRGANPITAGHVEYLQYKRFELIIGLDHSNDFVVF
jgi:hypothetical protein